MQSRTLRFDLLSVEQGLAQETVTAVVQDQLGFMWFGSQHGLSRFDGYRVTVYKNIPNDPHSLADNWVQVLYVDNKNRLWVGTRGGLQRFDAASQTFTRFAPGDALALGSAKYRVQAIVGDGENKLWIATNDGLQHFDPDAGKFSILRHDPADAGSLNDDHLVALVRDAKGDLWIGLHAGIDRLAAGAKSFDHFRIDDIKHPDAARNEVQAMLLDRSQAMWITTTEGLERWDTTAIVTGHQPKGRHLGLAQGLLPGLVTAIYQDHEGVVWLGTNTHGLHRWNPAADRFETYRHQSSDPHSVASNEVSTLYQDRAGTLWVGTWTAGVKRVDLSSGGFTRYFHVPGVANSLSDDRMFAITGDAGGHLFLGTFGAINRMDTSSGDVKVYRARKKENGLRDDEIALTIYQDPGGQWWVGTVFGLRKFDPVSGQLSVPVFHTGDPNRDSINKITADHAGIMWLSSRGGLHRYDAATGALKTFVHNAADPSSLTENWIRMTLEDRQGGRWVATDDGLDRLDPATGRFTHFRHDPNNPASLSNDRIQYLYEDKKGVLWIGTAGGLNRLDVKPDGSPSFHTYTTKDGLGADSIGGILEDNAGHIWLGTATGVSRLDPATGDFRNYTARDGMIEGYYYVGSAFKDADGTLYFGGFNGLTGFRPEQIRNNPYPPPVVLTDLQVLGQSIHGGTSQNGIVLKDAIEDAKALKLSSSQSVFSLEFSALHYADPQRNRFAYQLQGFDKDWVYTDASKRIATYTNLDPGRYVFRVKAANKDGVWNDAGATLAITITPPYWQTWWFRALAALLVFGAGWLIYRTRIRILTDQKKLLEAQVTARTSEVVQQKEIVEQKNALLEFQKQEVEHQRNEAETAHRHLQAAQEQLVSQEKLAALGSLVAGVAHELNTPIGNSLMAASTLLERTGSIETKVVEQKIHRSDLLLYISQAKLASELLMRALTSAADLVGSFKRVAVDRTTEQRRVFDLHKTCRDIVATMINQISRYDHAIELSIADNIELDSYPGPFGQVMLNLINNALLHAFENRTGGRMRLTASQPVAGRVLIEFSDNGAGIAKENLKRIFDPFYTTKLGKGGSGLGLSISHNIVTSVLDGQIAVHSTVGAGTTFTLDLPLKAPPHQSFHMSQA